MALFYPSLEDIWNNQREKPTPGEWKFLNYLKLLDDSFQVFFQTHLNIAHPDIVILRKKGGVMIIEIKDWNLGNYAYFPATRYSEEYMVVKGEASHLSTPFKQVQNYKDDLFDCMSPALFARRLADHARHQKAHIYLLVKTAVYFSVASTANVQALFEPSNKLSNDFYHKKYGDYIRYWTSSDTGRFITNQIRSLMKDDDEFTDDLYDDIRCLLVPSEELTEQSQPFELSAEQSRFTVCDHSKTKLYGAAGSGKTMIIAQKAINCYQATQQPVLILTYNITLCSYIEDKIARNTRDWSQRDRRRAFDIVHYDRFLPQIMQKYGLANPLIDCFRTQDEKKEIDWDKYREEQMNRIRNHSSHVRKYSTVLIDEAQDYHPEWFEFINEIFIADGANYMVTADEKQNIYNRKMDVDKRPKVPGIPGRWGHIKGTWRLPIRIADMALDFQIQVFGTKYNIEKAEQLNMFSLPGEITYLELDSGSDPNEGVMQTIEEICRTPVSRNDIAVLTFTHYRIRGLMQLYMNRFGPESVETTSETKAVYNNLKRKYPNADISPKEYTRFREELNKYRSALKRRFHMNPGTIKMSTIHSFKGWEIPCTIIVLEDEAAVKQEGEDINFDELLYTAITRAKKKLVIINLDNEKYRQYFKHLMKRMAYLFEKEA